MKNPRTVAGIALLLLLPACTGAVGTVPAPHCTGLKHDLQALDVSGSARSGALLQERLAAIGTSAEHDAYCRASLTVLAFSGTTGSSSVLYDEVPPLKGATDIARRRHLSTAGDHVVSAVKRSLAAALSRDPGAGTDIAAALTALADIAVQRTGSSRATIYTDGITSVGAGNIDRAHLSAAQAQRAADAASVVSLHGMPVLISGVGRTGGTPPPAAYVAAVRLYLARLCHRADAQCTVVTETVAS